MGLREIINNLKLIDRVVPDYTSGRNRGLSDEESEKLPLEAVYMAIEILERQQLQWLLDNVGSIKIMGIHPDGHSGSPTLLIELEKWDIAKTSDFKVYDSCIIFE